MSHKVLNITLKNDDATNKINIGNIYIDTDEGTLDYVGIDGDPEHIILFDCNGSGSGSSNTGGTAIPTLSGPASANESTDVSITITNYDASFTYSISITGGSYSRTNNTITWTLPSVNADTNHTISVTAEDTVNGLSTSSAGTLVVYVLEAGTATDSPIIDIANGVNENTNIFADITNYDNTATYDITADKGTIFLNNNNTFVYTAPDISDATDTTDTITAYATASGYTQSAATNIVINVYYVNTSDDDAISIPNFSADTESNNGFNF